MSSLMINWACSTTTGANTGLISCDVRTVAKASGYRSSR